MQGFSTLLISFLAFLSPCAQAAALQMFDPAKEDIPIIDEISPPGMATFQIPSGDGLMNAFIYTANGTGPHPTIIFFNGFPGNEKDLDLLQALRRGGFNTVFFHHRGSWGSSGVYSMAGIIEDGQAAIKHLRALGDEGKYKVDPNRLSIMGHSLGGFTVLAVGLTDRQLACTIAITPIDLHIYTSSFLTNGTNLTTGRAVQNVPGLTNYSFADLVKEGSSNKSVFHLAPHMHEFNGRSLLFVSGSKDTAVPLAHQKPLIEAARNGGANPFAHITLKGDHVFSENRIELIQAIWEWAAANCR